MGMLLYSRIHEKNSHTVCCHLNKQQDFTQECHHLTEILKPYLQGPIRFQHFIYQVIKFVLPPTDLTLDLIDF